MLDSGFVESVDAFVDTTHLTTSWADFRMEMDSGNSFEFAGTWTAWSDRMLFGNDGPATGREHVVVDPCLTSVSIGHQKFRFAHMTGTANGQPVASYQSLDASAAVFNNNFRYIDVAHGRCA